MKKKIISLAMMSGIGFSYATVHTVSNVSNSIADFTTLQSAIDAATANDTIYVGPSGVSYGSVNIPKKLVFIGAGTFPQGQASLRSLVSQMNFTNSAASGTVIKGFDFHSASTSNNITANGSLNLFDIVIESNRLTSMLFNSPMTNLIVRNNMFPSVSSFAFAFQNQTTTNCIISNNIFRIGSFSVTKIFTNIAPSSSSNLFSNNFIFTTHANNPLRETIQFTIVNNIIQGGGSPNATDLIPFCNISHNLFFGNYTEAGIIAVSSNGANNLFGTSFSPVFNEISTINDMWNFAPVAPFTDLNLAPGSPAAGSGTNGDDMGIYAGSFPWYDNPAGANRRYYPGSRIPEIYEFNSPGVAAPNSVMQVQIKARNAN